MNPQVEERLSDEEEEDETTEINQLNKNKNEEEIEEEQNSIEEFNAQEVRKAHEQYLIQQKTSSIITSSSNNQNSINQSIPPSAPAETLDENKLLQHREASMEAVLDLAELEQVQREAERLKGLGNKHMANHEYTRACNAYSAALQLAPVGPSSHVFLSNRSAALLSLKQYSAAALDAKRAIQMSNGSYGKAYARLGQALYFSKDYGAAIEAYEEAVKLDPDNAVTWAYLAKARGKFQKYKQKQKNQQDSNLSITDNASLDQSSTVATQITQMPSSVLNNTDTQDSNDNNFPTDENNQEQSPDREEASRLFLRGNHHSSRHDYRKAIDEYTAALFLCNDDVDISYHLYISRAIAHNQLEMHDAASSDARMAVGLQPQSADAYSTLGKSLFYLKDYRGAAIALEESLRLAPINSTTANIDSAYLNKAYAELQQSNEAKKRSAAVVPKLPPPRFVAREEAMMHTPSLPRMPISWPSQSYQSSHFRVAQERVVTFGEGPMGIKLNRGPDGMIRVLSINALKEDHAPITNRKGIIQVGDVVREVAGVDLRRPVTNIMWGDTVAFAKMAPRPIDLIVAKEVSAPPKSVLEELHKARHEEVLQQKKKSAVVVDLPSVDVGEEKDYDDNIENMPSNANYDESVSDSVQKSMEETDDLIRELVNNEVDENGASAEENELIDLNKNNDTEESLLEDNEQNQALKQYAIFEEVVVENIVENDAELPVENKEGSIEQTSIKNDMNIVETNNSKGNQLHTEDATHEIEGKEVEERHVISNEAIEEKDEYIKQKLLLSSQTQFLNYTKDEWNESCESRQEMCSGEVLLLQKSFLWFTNYEARIMVIFTNPNLIVLLCEPQSCQELKALLISSEYKSFTNKKDMLSSYLIVETILDPKMCKLRLSHLTTKTSYSNMEEKQKTDSKNIDPRTNTCFKLITPIHTFHFTLLKNEDEQDLEKVCSTTSFWEHELTISLYKAHKQLTNNAWKHQIILGTLYSYVILGEYDLLQHALFHMSHADQMIWIDAHDSDGYTVLHYACMRRLSKAVHILVNYNANALELSPQGSTAIHMSAEKLDDKSLSTILSCSSRPNANELDIDGQTPMYVAICRGKTVGDVRDATALNRCLNALEAWGGTIYSVKQPCLLPHPLQVLSKEWAHGEVRIILSCIFHFTSKSAGLPWEIEESSVSIGFFYDYPLHWALISFYQRLSLFEKENNGDILLPILIQNKGIFDITHTIEHLLQYGFEPNERLTVNSEHIQKNDTDTINLFYGFTPLQILASTALKCQELSTNEKFLDFAQKVHPHLNKIIVQSTKTLICYGARLAVACPIDPNENTTLKETPSLKNTFSRKYNHQNSSERDDKNESKDPDEKIRLTLNRTQLKLDENQNLIKFLGGNELLSKAKEEWEITSRIVLSSNSFIQFRDKEKSFDEKCCAICWKPFGKFMNRKHTCRVSLKKICDECSSKRIVEKNNVEFRVSDGIFNLARREKKLRTVKDAEIAIRRQEERQQRVTKLEKERFGDMKKEQEDSDRSSLFGSITKSVRNVFMEEVEVDASPKSNINDLQSSVARTRDAFLERGEKLNTLADKSDALKEASEGFAAMARQLREQEEKGLFSW